MAFGIKSLTKVFDWIITLINGLGALSVPSSTWLCLKPQSVGQMVSETAKKTLYFEKTMKQVESPEQGKRTAAAKAIETVWDWRSTDYNLKITIIKYLINYNLKIIYIMKKLLYF